MLLEHVIIFENFLKGVIVKTLSEAPQPDKKSLAPAKEHHVFEIATNRTTKFTAREATRPTGRFPNPTEAVAEFRKTRSETIAFANEIDGDLRSHFFRPRRPRRPRLLPAAYRPGPAWLCATRCKSNK